LAAREEVTARMPPARVRREPRRRLHRRNDWGRISAFWFFIGPLVAGLFLFKYVAIIWALLLSFSRAQGTIALGHWLGFQNYVSVLTDPDFRQAFITTLLFVLFIVPSTFAISLGLALLVHGIKRGQGFFRAVFFIPVAVSYVTASLVWRMGIFPSVDFGLMNKILIDLHMAPANWLYGPTPPLYWVAIVTVRLWLQAGFYMILFIAALQDIPAEIIEAARVDGARGWSMFRRVTFPMLANTSIAVLLLLMIAAFQAFDEFYNLLNGTALATIARPMMVYLYDVALGNQDYGVGSAGAFILTLIIVIFTLVQGRAFGWGRVE
jgi:multiple sugar transport system permease protein